MIKKPTKIPCHIEGFYHKSFTTDIQGMRGGVVWEFLTEKPRKNSLSHIRVFYQKILEFTLHGPSTHPLSSSMDAPRTLHTSFVNPLQLSQVLTTHREFDKKNSLRVSTSIWFLFRSKTLLRDREFQFVLSSETLTYDKEFWLVFDQNPLCGTRNLVGILVEFLNQKPRKNQPKSPTTSKGS